MQAPLALRVVEHQAHVFRRFWRGTVFGYVVNPLLYLTAIGFGLGDLVNRHSGTVSGLSYVDFVAPGMIAASAMQAAASDSLWPVMAGTKWIRVFHGMVATPLRPGDVFGGSVIWTGIRAAGGAAVFLAVAAALGAVPSFWAPFAIPAAALCAGAFAAPLSAFAATQETDARFPLIMRLGILPLFLVSGTFFPISQLPGWLQPFAWLSPLFHGVELCRAATTGDGSLALAGNVAVLAAFVAWGWRWGLRSFERKLAS